MTKEKAIDVLNMLKDYYNDKNKYVDDEIGYVGFDDEDNEALDMAIKALEAFEIPPHDNWDGYSSRLWKAAYERGKEDAEQKWIPVSERLPEKEMDCLVTDSLGKVHKVTFYHALDGRESYFSGCYCVRAWMPLPEPYRESEDKRTEERTEKHACDCISRQVANEPERKMGKWIRGEAYPHHIYCSECYKTFIPNDEFRVWANGDLPRKYCPNCGSKMEVDG